VTGPRTSTPAGTSSGTWSPWKTVVGFGVVSLAADMVYEGARSVYGPLLASLGASALVVGAVTGAGEATALAFRLVSGPLADRTGRYWTLTTVGYALTAICVPLLAVTPWLGGAGLAVAATLIIAERLGKAVRSPAKSALLADAAGQVGMGRGLGVHKALDQIGAFAGPLLVAGLVALTGSLAPGLAALAIPGALAMVLLAVTRRRAPRLEDPAENVPATRGTATRRPLPASFLWFAVGAGLSTAGLVTFGLIGFSLVDRNLVGDAVVPVLYAGAMAAGALAALATGELYDRIGGRVLLGLPPLAAAVPALAFGGSLPVVVAGVLLWGAAVGVQDSTVKALVADLVPRDRRATAYGVFAGVQGIGALAGGFLTGALLDTSTTALVWTVVGIQVVAEAVLLPVVLRSARSR
jgi:MFS family permease